MSITPWGPIPIRCFDPTCAGMLSRKWIAKQHLFTVNTLYPYYNQSMLSIAIQAGGQSRRMGQDKGLLSFLGEPLIERVVRRVAPIADEILITTNRPDDYRFLHIPLFGDLIPDRGALGGVYTALSAASHPMVAVVACDMPFVNAALVSALHMQASRDNADIVIPRTEHGLEPLHAVYRRETCLPHIAAALAADKWRVDSWFSQVKVEIYPLEKIRAHDPELLSFMNINTPEDLQAAIHRAQMLDDREI